jgi:hypothetical protein
MTSAPDIAYIFDPRFTGGTSAAIASELKVAVTLGRLQLHARRSAMFSGQDVAPALRQTLDALGLGLIWDAPQISADVVILHNPSFLRFQTDPHMRIVTRHLIVVAHENFLRPGKFESHDVRRCLDQIDQATLALRKSIAPVSGHNRTTIADWFSQNPGASGWQILAQDWFNICDFPLVPPTAKPADRRGRHSRPGPEKFPPLGDLDLCFPATAQSNVILGADMLLAAGLDRPHWTMVPFRGLELASYFQMMDFMVYFTALTWRESFGRVLAEGIAAGKVVVCDADTAATFGDAVVTTTPAQVDAVIAGFISDPESYRDQVARGQSWVGEHSPEAFRGRMAEVLKWRTGCDL